MTEDDKRKNLVAFLTDAVSIQMFEKAVRDFDIDYADVIQGSAEYAKVYLKDPNNIPKLLVIDLTDRDVPMKDLKDISEFCDPSVKVVVISNINDVNFCRNLLKIGVEDYLLKPLHSSFIKDLFFKIFKQDGDNYTKQDLFKNINMVGVISSRGGVGATTFAVNSAYLLAKDKGKKVLLMDSNFYTGDCYVLLDKRIDESYVDIINSNSNRIDDFLVDSIVQRIGEKLYLLSGNLQIGNFIKNELNDFKSLVDVIKGHYNYCVVDLNIHHHDVFNYFISELDQLYVVSELSLSSARDTARIISYAKKIKGDMHFSVILNNIGRDKRGTLSIGTFEKVTGINVSHTVPFDPLNPMSAANVGKLIAETKSGPLYNNIVNIVQEMCYEKDFAYKSSGVFKKKSVFSKIMNIFKRS